MHPWALLPAIVNALLFRQCNRQLQPWRPWPLHEADAMSCQKRATYARILELLRHNAAVCYEGDTMMTGRATAHFDHCDRLCFVSGEDRPVALSVTSGQTWPMDLTNVSVALHLPRRGGGTLKRRTAPFRLAVQAAGANLTAPGHGLCTGELVTVSPADDVPLPAPLADGAEYTVLAVDADTINLLDVGGATVTLVGGATALTVTQYATVSNEKSLLTLLLPRFVTASVQPGQAQDWQLVLTDAEGMTRIVLGTGLLDCFDQPLP